MDPGGSEYRRSGSVVGLPSESSNQPGGHSSPAILCTRTFPSATTEVPKSSTMGLPRVGTPAQNGFVLRRDLFPPGGATLGPAPWLLTIASIARPSAAAI